MLRSFSAASVLLLLAVAPVTAQQRIASAVAHRADSLPSLDSTGAAARAVAPAPRDAATAVTAILTVSDRGIVFASPDERTRLTLRARIQNLAEVTTVSDKNLAANEMNMAPRRVRLRLDGSILDPRLTVKLQLSFSRRDQDFDDTQAANVVRDAAAYWRFNPSFQVGFGQTKLPGNRQRVVSSSELQFAERSLVNNRFSVDRDQGLFARVDRRVAGMPWNLQYAISLGEGRNQPKQGAGVAHTVRGELLPFGAFTGGGDYFEGDILREPKPKLSVGVVYSHNSRTSRTGGQLGAALWEPRTMETAFLDALLKYRGLAVYHELALRNAANPITVRAGSANRYIYTGSGSLTQLSYYVGGWEPNARLARVSPNRDIWGQSAAMRQEQATIGLTRYFNRHRIKLMGEVTRNQSTDPLSGSRTRSLTFRLNSEIGI